MSEFRIGLALGSGGARGWAHIGVLRALSQSGIEPDVICGTSMGALVGAAYLTDQLDGLQHWSRSLGVMGVLRMMDPTLSGGGFVAVNKAFEQFRNSRTQINIEDLPKSFAVAATDISNGHEVWLRDGPLLQAVQASSAIPGLFPAVRVNDQWLVDGALVNPVPVSLCRALGATVVIAVNLNSGVPAVPRLKMKRMDEPPRDLISRLGQKLGGRLGFLAGLFGSRKTTVPSLLEIMSASLDVMQDRITRSRLAGDPPDVMISPRVSHIGVLDFDRAEELITIGEESTLAMRPAIELAIRR